MGVDAVCDRSAAVILNGFFNEKRDDGLISKLEHDKIVQTRPT